MRDSLKYRQVAQLHIEGLNQSFLATLGISFLALLYRAIDECTESVLFVEQNEDSGDIQGFISGSLGMGPVYRQMIKHPFTLLAALLPSLFSLAKIKRILEITKYGKGEKNGTNLPEYELLSIVVAPSARGTGCAENLFTKLVQYCKNRGIDAFRIVVGDSLEPAHKFYRRMGAVASDRTEVHQGQGSIVYIYKVV